MSYCPRCGYKHDQPMGADWHCVGDSAAEIARLRLDWKTEVCNVGEIVMEAEAKDAEIVRLREALDKMQQAPK